MRVLISKVMLLLRVKYRVGDENYNTKLIRYASTLVK
ncbi:hypothetical protein PF621_gp37 [Salmonella phage vB_SenTO17]|uniref:Uncharacterized protein n=1 Tax=Salmonella phage vB_SenTO17 TaxID=2732254 RepID=A0A7G3SZQ6_9CAUD|nr:hypothetical protein PF621_gp37 [Salmonella phage vB_SenTO17]QJQ80420.1 hypothetical protein vBSenTO17_37 [Salmonella phage vB_SenTO17]